MFFFIVLAPGVRRPPNVYELATISDWYTDGWHRTKLEYAIVKIWKPYF